jgi:hypothetical protein
MIVATYNMPGFTSESDARAMADACRVNLSRFETQADGSKRATVVTWSRDNLDALSADLDYGPDFVRYDLRVAK